MNFKIGTYFQQELLVTCSKFWENRSKISVTGAHNIIWSLICLNSVPGGPVNFILGADITTTPQQVGHKTVAMATLVV